VLKLLSVWSLRRALGPEQRRVLAAKKVEGTRPIAELVALLKPLGRLDAAGNAARRQVGGGAIAAGVAALVGCWIGMALSVPAPFFAVPAGLLICCIGLVLAWRSLRRVDLSDNLIHVALPLLRVLEEESDPRSLLTLSLDLSRPDVAEKQVDLKNLDGPGGRKIVESLYRDPWLSGRAVLADGARLTFAVVDDVRKRRQTRRNARGKTKTKIKMRFWRTYRAAVELPEEHYAAAGKAPDTPAKLSRVVKADALPRDPLPLLDLVAEVYRGATLKTPPKETLP
jgi:hypothetical protein